MYQIFSKIMLLKFDFKQLHEQCWKGIDEKIDMLYQKSFTIEDCLQPHPGYKALQNTEKDSLAEYVKFYKSKAKY